MNSCSVKYADLDILEASCVEEKKIFSECKIGHAEFKTGVRAWVSHLWVVELKIFHIFLYLE